MSTFSPASPYLFCTECLLEKIKTLQTDFMSQTFDSKQLFHQMLEPRLFLPFTAGRTFEFRVLEMSQ